jgi:PAS domain S-box-containing protein
MKPDAHAHDPGDLAGRFASVLAAKELAVALRGAVELGADLVGAEFGALFLARGADLSQETWHPAPAAPALREACEAIAREVAAGESPGTPSRLRVVEGIGLHAVAAGDPEGPRAVFVCGLPSCGDALESGATEWTGLLGGALACRARRHDSEALARASQAHYERWFKRLDEQIQVLDRERQKFAAMVGQSEDLIFVADLTRTIRWANPALLARACPDTATRSWLGRDCRALCRGWSEDGASAGCASCPLARAIERGETTHAEFRPHRAGERGTLYLTALPVKAPDGKAREVMVTVQDLSDLTALRRSEARYRALFDRSSDALLMVDSDTRAILFANATAGRLLGYAPGDFPSLALAELHGAPEWDELAPRYDALFVDAESAEFEGTFRARDGASKIASVSGTRIELEGRPAVLVAIRDVTERRRVERILRETEQRMSVVVSSAPIVLFAIDAAGRFTLSEGKGLEALGLEPGQVVGRNVFDLYRDVPEIGANVRRALAGEEFTAVVRVGPLWFETQHSPLFDAQGRVSGMLGVATDVTQRHALEDQLRQSQKLEAVGRLAGGVAHDFNNLLTAILGACELLLRDSSPETAAARHAEQIHKAGVRGALLTRQLLAFSRRDVQATRDFDVNLVVAEMHELLRRLVGEDVEFITLPTTSPAIVRADPSQVEQVLMNLVVNARDAMPDGGRITVEVCPAELDEAYCRTHSDAKPGSYVAIAVTDTGCGMSTDVQARIFEPFFTTKERGRGTGLGLSTVYGVVTQCGGSVGVYSEPGQGSSFKVYLPRAVDPALGEPDGPFSVRAPGGWETVLLVEDEDAVRAIAHEILVLYGYTVLEARDGVEALAVAAEFEDPIHLLLTDVVMPEMGGGELAQQLVRARPDARVLYMSGYPDDAVVRHGILEARTSFLQKPFSLEGLARRVRDVLDGRTNAAEADRLRAVA